MTPKANRGFVSFFITDQKLLVSFLTIIIYYLTLFHYFILDIYLRERRKPNDITMITLITDVGKLPSGTFSS